MTETEPQELVTAAIAVPVFGHKNHVGIDRRHGFIRSFAISDAASHDGRQLAQLLDPTIPRVRSGPAPLTARRATSRCRRRRGLVPQLQRPKPRGKPDAAASRSRQAARARARAAIEQVLAAQKRRLGAVIRSVGLARATARLGLANLVTNMIGLVWFETRPAPA